MLYIVLLSQWAAAITNPELPLGEVMRLAEVLQFLLISVDGEVTLAEGRFAIIGLALSTPDLAELSPTVDLTASATPGGSRTPTPIRTPATPSYPNPYPNPYP